jgi:aconitate hydratase
VTLVEEYARIHWQNLANFGIVPLRFADPADRERIEQGDLLRFEGLREALSSGVTLEVTNVTRGTTFTAEHDLSSRQVERILSGGVIRYMKQRLSDDEVGAAGRPA